MLLRTSPSKEASHRASENIDNSGASPRVPSLTTFKKCNHGLLRHALSSVHPRHSLTIVSVVSIINKIDFLFLKANLGTGNYNTD